MSTRIENTVTAGTFSLDGGTWEVENNVWVIGDDERCVVIDPAHDLEAVAGLVGDREVTAILLTHAHDDHAGLAPEASLRFGAPVLLHPEDRPLWLLANPDTDVQPQPLSEGQRIPASGATLTVLHTPGHSPGSVCFLSEDLSWEGSSPVVFSGDTLFQGGPGATGRSFSDFPTIIDSITEKLLSLDPGTAVLTGHGETTTIGAEAPHRQEWIDRGH
ncbi:MBL fold metallo-hydrolase [Rothia kristinae]|uniref:MBL fold metallo-hydrolase n=1 Tax=Rothia kristinae TaxID=37923 RepID=UPI002446C06F|nr:MBL fold metallo-hydrolase [Rothia kristinae]WGH10164.1 MBL fold metallo-hydrolase [Rothia kristinae]